MLLNALLCIFETSNGNVIICQMGNIEDLENALKFEVHHDAHVASFTPNVAVNQMGSNVVLGDS